MSTPRPASELVCTVSSHRTAGRGLRSCSAWLTGCLGLVLCAGVPQLGAQVSTRPQPRITADLSSAASVELPGSVMPQALAANDVGAVPGSMQLQGMMLVFSRSAAQQADLDALLAAQQDPSSPEYHQWLTPAQFGARFGMADADIATAETWLEQQGFSIDSVANSRDRIRFSGTAAQVAGAFGAPLHYYRAAGSSETHYAPSAALRLPAPLANVVVGVTSVSNFRPRPQIVRAAQPHFTSATSGNHFITPGDVVTIYDVQPAYNAGYTGQGQTIAILGQSAIYTADIAAFQSAIGQTPKQPTQILVPSTGASTVYKGDELESDADLEYTGAIAKGATVLFVYAGATGDVFSSSLEYAVNNDIAPIISSSYGDCEPDLGSSYYATFNGFLAQAAAQGQTVVAAAGDAGSSDCYGITRDTTAVQESLAVDFPGSSQYVTAIGGSEFPAASVVAGNNTYFTAQGSTDAVSSALSYIPETTWNDDSSSGGLGAGGGGVSINTARPSWQANTVPGMSAFTSNYRLVPDVSLDASPVNAPYAYCSSDTTYWSTGQVSSCTSGLRDASTGDLTIAGGTSYGAPIFAALVAILNQAKGYTGGQGLVNPTLYSLASTPATYAAAFHDIASGGNQCLAGVNYCSGAPVTSYAAGTGYDLATGLGSVDFNQLLTAWPKNSVAAGSSFTLSAAAASAAAGTNATSNVTVTPVGGYTGTVKFRVASLATIPYACYTVSNATVTGSTAVTATVTVLTNQSSCSTGTPLLVAGTGANAANHVAPSPAGRSHSPARWPASLAAVGLLSLLLLPRSRRRLGAQLTLGLLLCVGVAGFGLSGCSSSTSTTPTGSGTTTTPSVTTPTGTYSVVITGTDSTNSLKSASTTLTLTVQ